LVRELYLNEMKLELQSYEEEKKKGLIKISVKFPVTSEEYHEVATMLYEGTFDVRMTNYFTSITNLYEKDKVGIYSLTLQQMG